jgi:hypothetical protein
MAKIFQHTSITVNGQTYRSVEEMPPDVRQTYEQLMSRVRADANQNGIADVFEGKPKDGTSVAQVTTSVQSFGGELPATGLTTVSPEIRERALARAAEAMSMAALSESGSSGSGGGIYLTWPTLMALLATAAVIGAAVAWFIKMNHP